MLRLINPPKRLREMVGRVFSTELQKLLDDLLAFEPAQRPADAGELIRRLAQVPEAASLAQRSSLAHGGQPDVEGGLSECAHETRVGG